MMVAFVRSGDKVPHEADNWMWLRRSDESLRWPRDGAGVFVPVLSVVRRLCEGTLK